jgi:iron(III) transport system substrate-binding protein
MFQLDLPRRRVLRATLLGAVGTLASAVLPAWAQQNPFGPPELIEAARKEGKLVLYTANFAEVEQETIKAFNKRFPTVKVEMVRAPGGQLITRVKTEAASGRLLADIVDHSDRGLMKALEDLFQDYAPPNAGDYLPDALVSPKLWPRITPGWSIAYNPALVKNPPKSWQDLTKPDYGNGLTGHVTAPSGGTTWTRAMFERQVLGEGYWAALANNKPQLYPSGAPLADALVRGEVSVAPLLYNIVYNKAKDGAPIESFFPPEGVPITPFATGISKTAQNPNAARLYLNWCMSEEGQKFQVEEIGNLSSLKTAKFPKGLDASRLWLPKFDEFQSLQAAWIEDWNKVFNYRQ